MRVAGGAAVGVGVDVEVSVGAAVAVGVAVAVAVAVGVAEGDAVAVSVGTAEGTEVSATSCLCEIAGGEGDAGGAAQPASRPPASASAATCLTSNRIQHLDGQPQVEVHPCRAEMKVQISLIQ